MAQHVAGGVREKIVTLESLQPPMTERPETRRASSRSAEGSSARRALLPDHGTAAPGDGQHGIEADDHRARPRGLNSAERARPSGRRCARARGGRARGQIRRGPRRRRLVRLDSQPVRPHRSHPGASDGTTHDDDAGSDSGRRENRDGFGLGHWPVRRAEDRRADANDRRLRVADAPRGRLLLRHRGRSAGTLPERVANDGRETHRGRELEPRDVLGRVRLLRTRAAGDWTEDPATSPSKTRIGSWSSSTRPMSITTWTTSRSPG